MVEYDAGVIQSFADTLYRQANTIIVVCAIVGLLFGGVSGLFGGASSSNGVPLGVALGIIGLVIGVFLGRAIAFGLKLRAQMALCQMKTEANTRAANSAAKTRAA